MVEGTVPHRRRARFRPWLVVLLSVGCLTWAPAAGSADGPGEREHARRASRPPLADRVLFGAFVGDGTGDTMVDDPSQLTDYESLVGADVQVASYFLQVGDVFPGPREREFADGGRRAVLLAWHLGSTRKYRFRAWARGRHDRYLRRIGRAAARYPYPIYVRPWPEMNADWVPFQPTASGRRPAGGTPAAFVRAWRHVVDTVRAAGGTNIRWVFNPTADTYAETTDVRKIWPGRAWVDVLGLDGYNWGNLPRWRSFSDVFAEQYRRLVSLGGRLPVWVCEYGSREPTEDDGAPPDPGRDKGRWLRAALTSSGWPRLQALVGFDIRKERDWRVSSSPSALDAVRASLADRPDPVTRRGLAAVGVAGLPPTVRGRTVAWGRPQDPRTVRYRVQTRRSGHRWSTVATTRAQVATVSRATRWTAVRVRGIDAGGHVRWTSLPAARP